jgi:hypothetical protein
VPSRSFVSPVWLITALVARETPPAVTDATLPHHEALTTAPTGRAPGDPCPG